MQFHERYENLCREKGKSTSRVGLEIGVTKSAVSYWKEGHVPKQETLAKLADYFDVSIEYLTGATDNRQSGINGDLIAKVALFGGDVDVTPEMWEEVKSFANYVKERHKRNSNK